MKGNLLNREYKDDKNLFLIRDYSNPARNFTAIKFWERHSVFVRLLNFKKNSKAIISNQPPGRIAHL